jgi:hypothetical protein
MMLLVTAPPPRVALSEVNADAPACVGIEQLRADIRARLGGRDPFDDAADRRVELRWSRRQRQFVARIDVIESDGQRGERVLVDRSCAELVPAVALAIAIAIDPRVALGTLPPEPEPTPVRVARPTEVESRAERAAIDLPPPRPAPPEPGLGWWLGVASFIEHGAVPGFGLAIAARFELGTTWRAAIEAGIGIGLPADVGTTRVRALGVVARAQACHVDSVSVCAGLAYARMNFSADQGLDAPVDEGRDMVAAVVGVGLQATHFLRVELGFAAPLTPRHTFKDGGDALWTAWPVQPSLRFLVIL